jgi:preprotein translocase subunit SecB
MTDNNTAPEAASPEKAAGPSFAVQRIYLKDLSFETPQGPAAFQKQWKPKVSQDLSTKSAKVDDNTYEVSLRITVTVKDEEETIYLIEAEQAGLFTLKGFEEQQVAQVLNVTCATMLLPYAREAIDSTLIKGSFPALMIPPINFESLFSTALKQSNEAMAESKAGANTH